MTKSASGDHARKSALLAAVGGGVGILVIIALCMTGWGPPGTDAYVTYERLNRLMAITLLMTAPVWVALSLRLSAYGRWAALVACIGVVTQAVGTAAEFWLYSELPYEGAGMRQFAYSAASVGGLLFGLGAMVSGVDLWRTQRAPRRLAGLLLLALPLDITAFLALNASFLSPVLLALAVGWALGRPSAHSTTAAPVRQSESS